MTTEKIPLDPLNPERIALTAAAIAGLCSGMTMAPSAETIKLLTTTDVIIADQTIYSLTLNQSKV